MGAQSESNYIPTPYMSISNVVWAEDLAEQLDTRVAEMSEARDVISVATTPMSADKGETLGVLVTVVWRVS
jgi:hypothetical protein